MKDEIKDRLDEQGQLFNTEDYGQITVETERERTLKVTQSYLKENLPCQVANNIFDLRLTDFGPYGSLSVTKNGRHVLLGGNKGHLAMLDWKKKDLVVEFNAKERVNDVCFLQNNTMFAVAQSKYLHIYDNQGIEIHCMRDHLDPVLLDYLPYHFLLTTASKRGKLTYLDVSTGQVISEAKTKRGIPACMAQNR